MCDLLKSIHMNSRRKKQTFGAVVIGLIIFLLRVGPDIYKFVTWKSDDPPRTDPYTFDFLTPSGAILTMMAPPTTDYSQLATNYAVNSSNALEQATLYSMMTQAAKGDFNFLNPTPTRRPVTRTPTLSPTTTPAVVALADGDSNTDWNPVIQTFDHVEQVLVPAGCFQSGETELCVEKAFWLDRYEITNILYGTEGIDRFSDRPVVNVTWQEAKTFCENRGARLPTAIEWQYTASGPDGWDYPWGNHFEATFANSCDNRCSLESHDSSYDDGYDYLASVVRYEQGVSWVGAYNMSGNIAEWVTDDDDSSLQSVHGGSWADDASKLLTTSRELRPATYKSDRIGFRCVRDY